MAGELLVMSQTELSRLEVIQKLKNKQLKQVDAARLLNLSARQMRKLQRRYEQYGAAGLVSKRRAKPSNNRLSEALKSQAVMLIQTHYPDFGPTLAHEKINRKSWSQFID